MTIWAHINVRFPRNGRIFRSLCANQRFRLPAFWKPSLVRRKLRPNGVFFRFILLNRRHTSLASSPITCWHYSSRAHVVFAEKSAGGPSRAGPAPVVSTLSRPMSMRNRMDGIIQELPGPSFYSCRKPSCRESSPRIGGSSQGVSKLFRNSSHVIRSWKAFCAALHSKQGTVRHPDSSTRKARVNSWRITLSTRLVTITRSAPREGRVTGRSAKACFGLHRRRTGSADSLTQTCRTRKCQPQAFGTCLLASAWYSTSCIRDEKARGCGAAPSSQRTEAQH